jgi:FkbM family methyltransferase
MISLKTLAAIADPRGHAHTIIQQIEAGMYDRWFAGRKDMTVIDCGANVGLFSLYAQPHCKHIVAIEPCPEHCAIFRELMGEHLARWQESPLSVQGVYRQTKGAATCIDLRETAIYGSLGEHVTVWRNSDNTTANSIIRRSDDGLGLNAVTLPWIIKQTGVHSVDFCKVDIEGSELRALEIPILIACRPVIKAYYIETHAIGTRSITEVRDDIELRFSEADYKTEVISHEAVYAWQ